MQDRRESVRDKVMYGGVAEIGERGTTRAANYDAGENRRTMRHHCLLAQRRMT